MSYKVKLQSFEGPFDLLVYLIENAEMSIYDIEISKITGQYLDYIKAMEEMDIAVSTEFMVLAASLIEIKSRMILPRINELGEGVVVLASGVDGKVNLMATATQGAMDKGAHAGNLVKGIAALVGGGGGGVNLEG